MPHCRRGITLRLSGWCTMVPFAVFSTDVILARLRELEEGSERELVGMKSGVSHRKMRETDDGAQEKKRMTRAMKRPSVTSACSVIITLE
eukprot:2316854-Rhodomonas_salina.2